MRILIYHASTVLLATAFKADLSIMYNTHESDDCTIRLLNETAVSYESKHPYGNYDECKAEFSCSVGQIPEYRIQRFEIEGDIYKQCKYDSLGLYINQTS